MKLTEKLNSSLILCALAASTLLTACGGGGGGSITTVPPVATTCSNGANNPPACDYVPASLQLTVPTPPYALGSEDLKGFEYLNNLRASLGLGKLAYSAELDKAAKNHLDYMSLNNTTGFDEDPSKPGYTGRTGPERYEYAGYKPFYQGGAGLGGGHTKSLAIQHQLNSIYHRNALIDQSYSHVGVGLVNYTDQDNPNDKFVGLHIIVANKPDTVQRNASDFVMTLPSNGMIDVDVTIGNEVPYGFPDYPDGNVNGKIGSPITIAVAKGSELSVIKFELTKGNSSESIPTYLRTFGNDPNKLIPNNQAHIISKSVLEFNTTYYVNFEGSVNGKKIAKTWNFTTTKSPILY